MGESHTSIVFAIIIVLGVVAGVRTACRGRSSKPRGPILEWKCPKCGEVYRRRATGDGRVPISSCPKCEAAAQRLVRYRCTQCGHEFELTIQVGQEGATLGPVVCPKCKDKRVLPETLYKKK